MDASALGVSRPFLTFSLDQELFAIDVAAVTQVLAFQRLTRVPQVPDGIPEAFGLRDDVVPVLDMRLKLGLGRTEPTADTCVVMVEFGREADRGVFGILVDSVQEVIELSPDVVVPPPELATGMGASLIRGLAKRSDRLVMVVDIEGMLTVEARRVAETAQKSWTPADVA